MLHQPKAQLVQLAFERDPASTFLQERELNQRLLMRFNTALRRLQLLVL
jgi:hypothetical protein